MRPSQYYVFRPLFLVPNFPLYKSKVVCPDNATVPLLRPLFLVPMTALFVLGCHYKDYLITLFNKDHVVSQEGGLINETLYLSLQQQ